MNKLETIGVSLVSIALPALVFAQTGQDLSWLISLIIFYLNKILFLLMALAIVMFVWFIIQYFIKPGDEGHRSEAKSYLMWSIIGFFVILSFWGIVNILENSFGLGNAYNQPQSWSSFMNIFPATGGNQTIFQDNYRFGPRGTVWQNSPTP